MSCPPRTHRRLPPSASYRFDAWVVAAVFSLLVAACGGSDGADEHGGPDSRARDAAADATTDGGARDPFFGALSEAGLGVYVDGNVPTTTTGGDVWVPLDAATDDSSVEGARDAGSVDAQVIDAGEDAEAVDASVVDAALDASFDGAADAMAQDAGQEDAAVDAAHDADVDAGDASSATCGDGSPATVDVSGSWSLTYTFQDISASLVIDLQQDGSDVQGRYTGPYGLAGSASGVVSGATLCMDLVDDGGTCPGSYSVVADVQGTMADVVLRGDSCAGPIDSTGVASRIDAGAP